MSLEEFSVRVVEAMAGADNAVLLPGGRLCMSPAMWDLVSHAEGEELRHLLNSLPIVELKEDPFNAISLSELRFH